MTSGECALLSIRHLPSTGDDDYRNDDDDRILERTCSVVRRYTGDSEPSTSWSQVQPPTNACVLASALIYDENNVSEKDCSTVDDIRSIRNDECLWIDIPGVADKNLLSSISQRFKIHPLVMLDVQTTEQRTKLDICEDAFFLVLKLIYIHPVTRKTHVEQMSFYLKENVLITFQERPKDIFDPVKKRIRVNRGRVRQSKIDYLFYSLLDTIVDQYMDVLDVANGQVEAIEDQLMKQLSRDTLEKIYALKREMLDYRRVITPLKEIINKLMKEEEIQIIQEGTLIYLRDLFDHVEQVNDTIDTYREMLASFIDFYMMLNSNAMNEVVKTLTIISTIFIPLTFVAGVYGMNFDNMPEIHWQYGYFVVLSGMLAIVLVMLIWFKRKGWL